MTAVRPQIAELSDTLLRDNRNLYLRLFAQDAATAVRMGEGTPARAARIADARDRRHFAHECDEELTRRGLPLIVEGDVVYADGHVWTVVDVLSRSS